MYIVKVNRALTVYNPARIDFTIAFSLEPPTSEVRTRAGQTGIQDTEVAPASAVTHSELLAGSLLPGSRLRRNRRTQCSVFGVPAVVNTVARLKAGEGGIVP